MGGAILATLFAGVDLYAQGQYYPVNPPGAPYGATYTGIVVHSNVNLQYLQNQLHVLFGPNVTLEVPIPTGSVAPTTAQFSAAATSCTQGVLSGNASPGVTLSALANEAVAWRPVDRAATAGAIAQAIVQFNNATAVANLTTMVDALAKSQPTLIDSILPAILTKAGAVSSVAPGISQLVLTAVSDIPRDLTRVATLVNGGLTALDDANLTPAQKTAAYIDPSTGYVRTLLGASVINSNLALIDVVAKSITTGNFLAMVPPSGGQTSLDQVLNAAVAALPMVNNLVMGAVTEGALRSQGANASAIATRLATASPSTANYTNAIVTGYSMGSKVGPYQSVLTANASLADAVAAGATVKAKLTTAVIVQWALVDGTATPPRNIVTAVIRANLSAAVATVTGAINSSTHTPYGTATFGDIAWAGANAAPLESVGNVVQAILQRSSSSLTTLNSGVVTSVVDNAIQGATAGSKTGAFADIVYKAENVARNTAGVSALLVKQAVDSLHTAGGASISYLGVVAALAGDVTGANRSAIQTNGFSELTLKGGDVTAATNGANLVQALQTNPTKSFTATLSAFNTASGSPSPANSVMADLYGAILANPNEADAALAAAIKQSTVSDATLTSVASDSLRGINSTMDANLRMVDTVVTHLKAQAVAVGGAIEDLFDFVGHQIVLNPTLTRDIVIAATVIDPDNAHFVAHSVAFNNPTGAAATVASIFTYAQITNPTPFARPSSSNPSGALSSKSFPGPTPGVIIDQPAAAAAITAGLTTGILEAHHTATNTQSALVATISAAVVASIAQDGTNLRGPVNPFNAAGDTSANFRQSDGATTTSIKSGVQQTVGPAGAITGYIAEVTNAGDTTISAITRAVLAAAVGGGARMYALEIAQAAGQALRWVGGASVSTALAGSLSVGNPAYDIANAMAKTVKGSFTLAQLENAVTFGINEAANGTIGAGALGLNATGLNPGTGTLTIKASGNANSDFYQLRSATGTPVTDIFNL